MRLARRLLVALAVVPLAACAGRERPLVVGRTRSEPPPRPPALRLDGSVVPREVALELTLDPAAETFQGRVAITAEVIRPTRIVWLHGKGLQVAKATVTSGGADLAATVLPGGEFLGLSLPRAIAPGPATLRLEYTGQVASKDIQGLFRQTEAGRTYLYSQFQPTSARLAFPGFDEPSYKVPWQLSLRVPADLVALSNTPASSETVEGNVKTVVFGKTRPIPSYLVALAVGPFDLIELGAFGRNKTPLRIAVTKGRSEEARYARKVTGEILVALENYFDMPYPYEKLDSVVVPSFLGGMENPGLITYAARAILAKPNEETPRFEEGYTGIAAHEIGHHWFGDLVTMAWWDDIWLNESFATFIADRILEDWHKSRGVAVSRIKGAEIALAADAIVSARKVHNPIQRHDDIAAVFDAISYQKGGALLDMFESWMGRPSFQRAVRAYVAAHAWGNSTSKDFIAALADASRPELAAAFESFLEQGGFPLVSLARECPAGKPPELVLSQERFLPIGSKGSADQTWSIPMCVGFARGKTSAVQCFLLSQKSQRVPLDSESCPAWIDGNAGGHGYYRVAYAGELGAALLEQNTLDSASRASALLNVKAAVAAGRTPIGTLLSAIPPAARDRDQDILAVALDLAESIDRLVDAPFVPNYERFLAATFARPARQLGWRVRRGESSKVTQLRQNLLQAAAVRGQEPSLVAGARAVVRRYLTDPTSADPRLAAVALAAVARAGGDPRLFPQVKDAFTKSEDRRYRAALLAGMVMSRDPAQRDETLALLGSADLSLEETFALILTARRDPSTREAAADYAAHHLDQLLTALPYLLRPEVLVLATATCDAENRSAIDTTYRAKLAPLPGGQKALTEGLESMDLCIARRQVHGPDVAAFLAKQ